MQAAKSVLRLGVVFALTLVVSVASADTTRMLSNGLGASSAPQVLVSAQQDVRFLFKTDIRLNFTTTTGEFLVFPVSLTPNLQPMGRLALGAGFNSLVAYRENGTPTGDNIKIGLSNGGGFNSIFFLTDDPVIDTEPDCCFTATGENEFVWESLPTPTDPKIYVFRDTPAPVLVADGEDPAIAATGGSTTFLAYLRGGDVFGKSHLGMGNLGVEETVASMPGDCTEVRAVGDFVGNAHVVFLNGGMLYYTNNIGGGFALPSSFGPVDDDGSITVAPDGTIVVGYTSAGVTYATERQAGSFTTPLALSPIGTTTSEGAVARDSSGYYHAVWIEAGDVYYHNNVPVPIPAFTANVQSGEQALDVTFSNQSTGLISRYEWDFGDGNTSNAPNPTHTYQLPGLYTVALTVEGPGGSDTLVQTDYIEVTTALHIINIPDLELTAGESVIHPVYVTHPMPMEGFTVALIYDEEWVTGLDVTLTGTYVEPFAPDLFLVGHFPDGANSILIHTVLLEVSLPIDGFAIAPGHYQRVSNIEYTISPVAPVGAVIPFTLTNNLLMPPQNNALAQGGFSTTPYLDHGSMTVIASPQDHFIRGDTSGNGSVDIADAVQLLAALFAGQAITGCLDAADANDSGQLNIADPIAILTRLFGGGPMLPYPSPECGLDPTPDSLSCSQNYCM